MLNNCMVDVVTTDMEGNVQKVESTNATSAARMIIRDIADEYATVNSAERGCVEMALRVPSGNGHIGVVYLHKTYTARNLNKACDSTFDYFDGIAAAFRENWIERIEGGQPGTVYALWFCLRGAIYSCFGCTEQALVSANVDNTIVCRLQPLEIFDVILMGMDDLSKVSEYAALAIATRPADKWAKFREPARTKVFFGHP